MDTYRLCLTLLCCGLLSQSVSAQSFMECSDIELDTERLSCYDAAAAAIKASIEKPQVGSSEQRQEQRNAEVAAIVFGEEAAPEIVEEVPSVQSDLLKPWTSPSPAV